MSGIGHAISKVFKGVVGIVKKIWRPLLVAAAIYFTAGMAAPLLAGAGAAEGGAAIAADIGASAAADAAAGMTVGAVADAGIGAVAAAGAGEAAGGALAAGAFGATDAATAAMAGDAAGFGGGVAADLGGASAGLGAAGEGAGVGALADTGAASSAIGDGSILGGGSSPVQAQMAQQGLPSGGLSGTGTPNIPGGGYNLPGPGGSGLGDGVAGQPSSWWQASLNTAKNVLQFPGVSSMLSQGINSYMSGQMYNQNLKWMAAHAPGQIAGGVPQGQFSGYGTNQNLAGQNVAQQGRVQPVKTQPGQFASNPAQTWNPNMVGPGGITADPSHLPYATPGANSPYAPSAPYPGYGTPGYGQQYGQQPISQQFAQQQGILGGGSEMPYVESPYDQSVV